MKKLFSLLIATLLIIGCYAAEETKTSKVVEAISATHQDIKDVASTIHDDTKDIISTIYGDSKDLAKNLYPEVKSAVVEIAKGIGVAAEHLYMVLVKKYVVEGLVQTIPFIIGFVLLIIGWIKTEKYIKLNSEQIRWPILYPLSLIGIGAICLCYVDYNTMFMGLINPEFGAINYILDFTKEMIK